MSPAAGGAGRVATPILVQRLVPESPWKVLGSCCSMLRPDALRTRRGEARAAHCTFPESS
ncbi:MAG: hypothetical protein ACE37B_19065 [Ilumatobacter sp.]|uniref:hypothetical protein n=1 Tax=Ilumatobacter sp. TaxID=1967498 RepID=UPI00391B32CB